MLTPHFSGETYLAGFDEDRLSKQLGRVFSAMKGGEWRTLSEIATITGDPAASISAQLRHLRKPEFGGHTVERRSRGHRSDGLFEYRVIVSDKGLCVPDGKKKKVSGFMRGFVAAARIVADAKDLTDAKANIRKQLEKLI